MVLGDKRKPLTMDEFIEFALRPENNDRDFELLNGEIVEWQPTSTYLAQISHLLAVRVYLYCEDHQIVCNISGGRGPYHVQGNVVVPRFAYKRAPMSDEYPDPVAPLWTMHVVAPTDQILPLRAGRNIYIKAGILYWELYPKSQSVDVYAPGQPMRTVGIEGVLDGGDVLPGFTLPMKELFPD